MTLTIEKVGRRNYIIGNTYAIKDDLRIAGCKWDSARKQWWSGSAAKVAKFAGRKVAVKRQDGPTDSSELRGKAKYKGRTYFILWAGQTSRGTNAVRLTTLDGSIAFWKDTDQVEIVKRYGRDRRDGGTEYPTLGSIRSFVTKKQAIKDGEPCPRCTKMMRSGKWSPYFGSGDYDDCSLCGATVQILY